MAQISQPTAEKKIYPGKAHRVLNLAKMEWFLVEFTNGEGRADVCIAAEVGKDPKSGEPQYAVIESQNVAQMFMEPHSWISKGINALRGQKTGGPVDLPMDGFAGAELGAEQE